MSFLNDLVSKYSGILSSAGQTLSNVGHFAGQEAQSVGNSIGQGIHNFSQPITAPNIGTSLNSQQPILPQLQQRFSQSPISQALQPNTPTADFLTGQSRGPNGQTVYPQLPPDLGLGFHSLENGIGNAVSHYSQQLLANAPEAMRILKGGSNLLGQVGEVKLGPELPSEALGLNVNKTPAIDPFIQGLENSSKGIPSVANQEGVAAIERNNLSPARPIQINNQGADLGKAAKNALYELFNTKQNIEQRGATTAQSVANALKTPQDQELFRQTIEHPENLPATKLQASNPALFEKATSDFSNFTDQAIKEYNSVASPTKKLGYLQNFYSHIVDLSNPETAAKFNDFVQAKLRNYSGWFSKGRVFSDINELRDAGFELKNQTAAQDVMDYTQGIAKGGSANAFVSEISKTHPSDVITLDSHNQGVPLPTGFIQLDPMNKMGLSGTFVSRNLYKQIGNSLGAGSALADNTVIKGFDFLNRLQKEIQLGLGGFHAFKTTIRQAVNDPLVIPTAFKNAFSPAARLASRQVAIADGTVDAASKMGVTLGRSGDLLAEGASTAEKLASKNPIEKFNSGLFGGLIDTYKLNLVKKAMTKFDLNNPAQLEEARRYGAQINNLMGGLNYTVLNRNKTIQQIARFATLAPDFNEGKIRQLATALNVTDWSKSAVFARYNVLGEAALLAGLAEVGRKLTTGKFDNNFKDFVSNAILSPSIPLPNTAMFNNPKSKKTQSADLPGSDIADIGRAIQDPVHFIEARGSAGVSTIAKLASGKDYYGNPLVDPFSGQSDNIINRVKTIGSQIVPIPAVQGEKLAQGKVTPADAALNTIGFRVKNNPNDPTTKSQTAYFNSLDQARSSLHNPNDLNAFNLLHPVTKDAQGNSLVTKTPYTKVSQFSALLDNPQALQAEITFQQSQSSHHPMWDLPQPQLRAYMQAQQINGADPSGDKATVKGLKAVLPPEFNQQVNDYYTKLQAQGVVLPQNPNTVKTPPEIQNFWDQYHQLPSGTGARSAALRTPLGQQALSLLNQQTDLTNAQRADMGLPLLPTGGGGSYSTKQARKPSIGRIKTVKLKMPKLVTAKSSAPKVTRVTQYRLPSIKRSGVKIPKVKRLKLT